jgi:cytochrome c556
MKGRKSWTSLVLAAIVAAAAGCATMQAMKPEEAIDARIKLMKQQGAAMRSINDKLKAGQVQAVATDAETLRTTAKQIPALFPKDSLNPQVSRAKPEIWQKWSDFEANAKLLESQAVKLADTAKSGNAQATDAVAKDLGRQTCGACHNAFRGPEIKK